MKKKIISISNFKGGSGKTTIGVNLAFALSTLGHKVLIIDADMQMNTTHTLGKTQDINNSIYHALTTETAFKDYIQRTKYKNLDIIISDYEMAYVDLEIFVKQQRETLIKRLLEDKKIEDYDFIIMDTNPSLGLVTQNCLIAADYVLIPVELSKYGIQGLATLTRYFEKAIKQINKDFEVLGVIMNKVDNRKSVTVAGKDVLKKLFGEHLTDTFISTDANIESAQWNDEPVIMYDKNSKAAKQFIALANEVIERVKNN